ncbi:hypothetical protein JOM56_006896 [Amanita muscaria]
MASPSILAASRTATFTSLKSAASTKSILKRASRPTPLPLSPSPFPFTASFNIKVSASVLSPHVHFPPSPLLYSTLSAASFDLSSSLSPSLPASANVLEPPVSAEPTMLSPAFAPVGFKLLDPPKSKRKPAVHFQDPRSPRPVLMASLNAAALTLGTEPTTELGKALMAYPRSPYPSAPLSPERSGAMFSDDAQQQSRASLKRRHTADNAILTTRNGGSNTASAVTFQLTLSRRLAPPHLDLSAAMVEPSTNSLSPVREFEIDLTENAVDDASPESAGLSDAFWESVSLEDGALASAAAAAEGSDAGFPESVTGSQVSDTEEAASFLNVHDHEHALVPRSPVPSPMPPPAMLFGDSDGALWSPGIPREQDQASFTQRGFLGIKRSTFAAPSPKDPLARFPTFALALQRVPVTNSMDKIKPPPRAHLV